MEKLDNRILQDIVELHKSGERLKAEFLYQKEVDKFVFSSLENLSGYPIQNSIFINCIFDSVDFSASFLNGSKFENCVFINSQFVKTEMVNTGFSNSVFKNCNLFRAQIVDAQLYNCIFDSCKIEMTSFGNSELINTIFNSVQGHPFLNETKEKNVMRTTGDKGITT